MRIRLSPEADFSRLALDEASMLVVRELTKVDYLGLMELVERVPGEPTDVMISLHRLAGLGVLTLEGDGGERYDVEPIATQPPEPLSRLHGRSEPALVLPRIMSIRPSRDPHVAVTARPVAPLPIAEMFRAAEGPLDGLRVTLRNARAEQVARSLRRENLRALVDDASDALAAELKDVC